MKSCACLFVFFFSSRRRHTRLQGDWSSDVCSSDLASLPITLVATCPENTMIGIESINAVASGVTVFVAAGPEVTMAMRSEEHTSELQSPCNLVCRLLLEKKNNDKRIHPNLYRLTAC